MSWIHLYGKEPYPLHMNKQRAMLVFTLGVLPLLKLVWCQESGTEYTPGISQNDTDCQLFSTKGRDYRGIANTTVNGIPCQPWSATKSHICPPVYPCGGAQLLQEPCWQWRWPGLVLCQYHWAWMGLLCCSLLPKGERNSVSKPFPEIKASDSQTQILWKNFFTNW